MLGINGVGVKKGETVGEVFCNQHLKDLSILDSRKSKDSIPWIGLLNYKPLR